MPPPPDQHQMPASPSHPSPSPAPATPSSTVATPRSRRRPLPSKSNHSPTPVAPSSPFSFFPPTSPSPFHRFLPSPLRASSVPFSWEHRPGIPKTPARNRSSSSKGKPLPLPLPPSLLSGSCGGPDPYASVVAADYAAMHPPGRLGKVRRTRRPRLGDALAEWLSVLSLYRSFKRAASCFAAKGKSSSSAA